MNNPKVIQEVYETEITGKYNVAVCPVIPCCAVTGQVAGTAAAMTDDFIVKSHPDKTGKDGVVLHANDNYKKQGAAEATPLLLYVADFANASAIISVTSAQRLAAIASKVG